MEKKSLHDCAHLTFRTHSSGPEFGSGIEGQEKWFRNLLFNIPLSDSEDERDRILQAPTAGAGGHTVCVPAAHRLSSAGFGLPPPSSFSEAAAPPYPPHWYRPAGYSQAAPIAANPSLAHAAAAAAAAAAAYMPSLVGASYLVVRRLR